MRGVLLKIARSNQTSMPGEFPASDYDCRSNALQGSSNGTFQFHHLNSNASHDSNNDVHQPPHCNSKALQKSSDDTRQFCRSNSNGAPESNDETYRCNTNALQESNYDACKICHPCSNTNNVAQLEEKSAIWEAMKSKTLIWRTFLLVIIW